MFERCRGLSQVTLPTGLLLFDDSVWLIGVSCRAGPRTGSL